MTVSELKTHHGEQYRSAYSEIKKTMSENGFYWVQGSTCTTEQSLVAVTMAMNALNKIDWFRKSVRDIRAFRTEDWSDFTALFKGSASRQLAEQGKSTLE